MIFGLGAQGRGDRPALIDPAAAQSLGYDGLTERMAAWAGTLAGPKRLALLAAVPRLDTVSVYLALLEAGHAVMLMPPDLAPVRLAHLLMLYRPDWLGGWPEQPGYVADILGLQARTQSDDDPPLHPDLCLLLSTSGSAGSPRMVRLSRHAVEANAAAIAQALAITAADRAATTLPLSYSYGLSVLHSHLWAGATVVLSGDSVVARSFWDMAATQQLTTLAGVPFVWQSLRRLDLLALAPPSLRVATQAGGRLDPRLIVHFHQLLTPRGGGMFTMYGQTEATARMTVLALDQLPHRAGSVGRAIPGGAIRVENGRVVYTGANVMMGYAEARADLARGDQLGGVLETGDLGHLDDDGYLWLDGRAGRLAKVMGLRLDLDEVQARAAVLGPAGAVVRGDDLVLLLAADLPDAAARAAFAADLGVPAAALRWRRVDAIPLGGNGKVDVTALETLA